MYHPRVMQMKIVVRAPRMVMHKSIKERFSYGDVYADDLASTPRVSTPTRLMENVVRLCPVAMGMPLSDGWHVAAIVSIKQPWAFCS